MFRFLSIALVLLFLCACRETVVHNLSEPDANRMLAHLYDQQLNPKKVKQADARWSLSLPQDQVAKAIKSLDANKLLRNEVADLHEQSGFMSSQEQERFRFERALSREIEVTLSSLPTVLQARVHLNMPVKDPILGLKADAGQASASVMLLTNAEETNREQVVALVAGASGVSASNISVVISLPVESGTAQLAEQLVLDKERSEEAKAEQAQAEKTQVISNSVINAYLISLISELKSMLFSLPVLSLIVLSAVFILVFRRLNRRQKIII